MLRFIEIFRHVVELCVLTWKGFYHMVRGKASLVHKGESPSSGHGVWEALGEREHCYSEALQDELPEGRLSWSVTTRASRC